MELIGFTIQDQIALLTDDGHYFDLHSNFDFKRLEYDVTNQYILFSWEKSRGSWAKDEEIGSLQLRFYDVSYFIIHQKTELKSLVDEQSLSFIGYVHPQDLEIMDGSLSTNNGEKDYHIILGFESGMSVRIYAKEVRLSYSK